MLGSLTVGYHRGLQALDMHLQAADKKSARICLRTSCSSLVRPLGMGHRTAIKIERVSAIPHDISCISCAGFVSGHTQVPDSKRFAAEDGSKQSHTYHCPAFPSRFSRLCPSTSLRAGCLDTLAAEENRSHSRSDCESPSSSRAC